MATEASMRKAAATSARGSARVSLEKSSGLITGHDELVKRLRRFLEFQAQRFVEKEGIDGHLSLTVYAGLEK